MELPLSAWRMRTDERLERIEESQRTALKIAVTTLLTALGACAGIIIELLHHGG